jgi:hypothetical protein
MQHINLGIFNDLKKLMEPLRGSKIKYHVRILIMMEPLRGSVIT